MAKLDAERRGRERFGSRSVDAAAPGRLKLSRRAWNEYACAIAKGGASMIKPRNAILGLLFYEFLRTILSPHTFANRMLRLSPPSKAEVCLVVIPIG